MSNHLAIATVTATLKYAIQKALDAEFAGAKATAVRPNARAADLPNQHGGANVFLYHAAPNVAFRNADLPTRRGDGSLVQGPVTALELHYLITFHGDDKKYEPQRVMAIVARLLHARPVLTRADITAAVGADTTGVLTGSDLADQVEPVRITPTALSLEEMSKLWSVMLQTPYVLSMAYQASLVLIERRVAAPAPLPVKEAHVVAYPILRPLLERVLIAGAGGQPLAGPVLPGSTLVLTGSELAGSAPWETWVRLGGGLLKPATVSDSEVRIAVPPALHAGVRAAQISHRMPLGANQMLQGAESAVAPFVLHPRCTFTIAGTTVKVTNLEPKVASEQRVTLLLSQLPATVAAGAKPRSYAFVLPERLSGPDKDAFDIATTGVTTGQYLARLQVDGAESLLEQDANGTYHKPVLTFR